MVGFCTICASIGFVDRLETAIRSLTPSGDAVIQRGMKEEQAVPLKGQNLQDVDLIKYCPPVPGAPTYMGGAEWHYRKMFIDQQLADYGVA